MINDKMNNRPEDHLDPQMKDFLAMTAAEARKHGNPFALPIREARAAIEAAQRPFAVGGPEMASIDNRWIEIDGRRLLARVYLPQERHKGPAVVFLHGGGWTWNSIDTHDRVAREYASRTGFAVIAPDYAMAPEYPFPTPLMECMQVVEWLQANGAELAIDAERIAVAGDSAGANLALATCMMLRERRGMAPAAALLNYGAFSTRTDRPSFDWLGESTLSPQTWKIRWFWKSYLGTETTDDWRAAPLCGNLAGLPPIRVQVGELDVLHDENVELADRVRQAGGQAECAVYDGVTHGFLRAAGRVDQADRALEDGSQWLVRALRS